QQPRLSQSRRIRDRARSLTTTPMVSVKAEQAQPPIRSRRGRRRRRPGKLHGDKGYDYNHLRRWLRGRGITPRIARKGTDSSQRLGRHRWTIERTMAWLAGCRRLHRRYERKASHFLAFTSIACTLICYRRLAN
ncbi:transposase, partial [Streptomyces flaveolus]|uniref:transposase n=1 Tax=Streptomyces flaveolus TaxID=67297 RepID=UPI003423E694